MGLRCLLGHDFGEPETERERSEEGSEVVTTVREVKTCERCGERQVVSENKEITSLDQLRGRDADGEGSATAWGADQEAAEATVEDSVVESAGEEPVVESAGDEPAVESEGQTTTDDAGTAEADEPAVDDLIADAEDEPAAGEQPTHPAERGRSPDDVDEDVDDDAVIMDDAPDEGESGYEQWHGETEDAPEEVEGGNGPATGDEDAVIMDGESGVPESPELDGESTPGDEADDPAEDSAESRNGGIIMGDASSSDGGHGDAAFPGNESGPDQSGPEVDGAGGRLDLDRSDREARLQYYCPDCGLTRPVGNSSMRAGDICPDCRQGYIQEREKPA